MSTIDRTDADSLPLQLAELLSATIQTRLMFEAFRTRIPEGAVSEFLPVVNRLLEIEIQLRQLNIQHPMADVQTRASLRLLH
jgi:hypothetical protein